MGFCCGSTTNKRGSVNPVYLQGCTARSIRKTSVSGQADMIKKLKERDQMFTDTDFPAAHRSIQGTSKDPSRMTDIKRFSTEWKRAKDFTSAKVAGGEPELFKGGIDPNDIKQGMLGDCYFVAALATLAEWPERVKKIFVSEKSNGQGLYGVNLYIDGYMQTVWVDDFFPVFNDEVASVRKANGAKLGEPGEPIFSAAMGNELWVAIAEKAYAKIHKGYVIIAGGSCGPTLRDLCGAPAYTVCWEQNEMVYGLWEKIIEGEEQNYAMSAGSPGTDEGSLNKSGIVPGHAYSLLAGKVIEDANGEEQYLVKMRNPWKEGEWSGAFGDGSEEMTEELMAELGHEQTDDGIFWMRYEDMLKEFEQVDICKCVDDYFYSFIQIPETKAGYTLLQFEVKSEMYALTTFTVTQRGCRSEEANGVPFDLNDYSRQVDIGFAKVKNPATWKGVEDKDSMDPKNFEIIKGGKKEVSAYALRDTHVEFQNFAAGTYLMYIEVQWNGKSPCKTYCANCYGPSEVTYKGDFSNSVKQEQAGLVTGVYKVEGADVEYEKPVTRFGEYTHFSKWQLARYWEVNHAAKPSEDGSYDVTAHDGDTSTNKPQHMVRVNQVPDIGDDVISYLNEDESWAVKGKLISKDADGTYLVEHEEGADSVPSSWVHGIK